MRNQQVDNGPTPWLSPLRTFYTSFTVKPGAKVVISVTSEADGVDPVVVAYNRKYPSIFEEYPVNILAFNDDVSGSNRNAQVSFTNPTVIDLKVEMVAFNYLPANAGRVSVAIMNGIGLKTWTHRLVGGAVQYAGASITVPDGCSPTRTRMSEWENSTGHNAIQNLVVDIPSKRGVRIFGASDFGSRWFDFEPAINYGYPNFALIFEGMESTDNNFASADFCTFHLKQQDFYSCVQ